MTENQEILYEMRERLKQEEISEFVKGMHALGYSDKEIETGLQLFLHRKKGDDFID